jgi:hypothetical protein
MQKSRPLGKPKFKKPKADISVLTYRNDIIQVYAFIERVENRLRHPQAKEAVIPVITRFEAKTFATIVGCERAAAKTAKAVRGGFNASIGESQRGEGMQC